MTLPFFIMYFLDLDKGKAPCCLCQTRQTLWLQWKTFHCTVRLTYRDVDFPGLSGFGFLFFFRYGPPVSQGVKFFTSQVMTKLWFSRIFFFSIFYPSKMFPLLAPDFKHGATYLTWPSCLCFGCSISNVLWSVSFWTFHFWYLYCSGSFINLWIQTQKF